MDNKWEPMNDISRDDMVRIVFFKDHLTFMWNNIWGERLKG